MVCGSRTERSSDKGILVRMVVGLAKVDWLSGDRGYDAEWFAEALKNKGMRPCMPGRKRCKTTAQNDKRWRKQRDHPF